MKRFIETLKNIFKIEDLRNRLWQTFLLLLIYRLGSFVVLPGIDPNLLTAYHAKAQGGLMGLLDMFSGGAFSNASIFALGIMPYISASIVVQLLGIAVPYFQRLHKEGESGRRKINQITRYLTVIVLVGQSIAYIANLRSQIPADAFMYQTAQGTLTFGFRLGAVLALTAGGMFVLWLGERITDRGIGNGISLIIMIGIIARLPGAIGQEFISRTERSFSAGMLMIIIEFVFLFLVFMGSILLVQGTRRIPVQYAKRIVGNKQYGGVRQYIPLKVNAAGVMPIIFAQAIMFIPMFFTGFAGTDSMSRVWAVLADHTGFWYNFIQFTLVVLFTWFYTAITINPTQMADDMKRNSGFIPGIKPGKKTVDYLDMIMSRITLPGSIFLGIVTILPAFAMRAGVQQSFAYFYGGTSLLIMVGVVLDTLQQIESHLLMRHYDGLMKSGRIKGRSGGLY
ncbi:MAG: preprotein translocase subunit SecY [Bacteroidales bacterium]|jgi:preprotein translocase subunit SecY|nr:preprotein translocase subunit SecY [Bacteroidales bacterium]